MSDSTSILDLPSDPAGPSSGGNVQIIANEPAMAMQPPQHPQQNAGSAFSLDQTTINQIVSGIQQASASGATLLPSRDIPMNPSIVTNDAFIQPNFVPPPPQQTHQDYINDEETAQDILQRYGQQKAHSDRLDDMYSELQAPLLLAALYFLFQLPFFRKFLMSAFPVFFSLDGNLNIKGFIFMSALFGLTYHLLNKFNVYVGNAF